MKPLTDKKVPFVAYDKTLKEGDLIAIMAYNNKVALFGSFVYYEVYADGAGPVVHYIPRYDINGAPIERLVPTSADADKCHRATDVIKQTIFEARRQITALESVLIKAGGTV